MRADLSIKPRILKPLPVSSERKEVQPFRSRVKDLNLDFEHMNEPSVELYVKEHELWHNRFINVFGVNSPKLSLAEELDDALGVVEPIVIDTNRREPLQRAANDIVEAISSIGPCHCNGHLNNPVSPANIKLGTASDMRVFNIHLIDAASALARLGNVDDYGSRYSRIKKFLDKASRQTAEDIVLSTDPSQIDKAISEIGTRKVLKRSDLHKIAEKSGFYPECPPELDESLQQELLDLGLSKENVEYFAYRIAHLNEYEIKDDK